MCSLITEREMQQFNFTPAENSSPRYWQSKAEDMLESGKNNEELFISFTTNGGSFRVKTKIVAVVDNYLRIRENVIIPVTSIKKIYPEMPPKIVVAEDDPYLFYKILIAIALFIATTILLSLYMSM